MGIKIGPLERSSENGTENQRLFQLITLSLTRLSHTFYTTFLCQEILNILPLINI
jgi:hypothetical protein